MQQGPIKPIQLLDTRPSFLNKPPRPRVILPPGLIALPTPPCPNSHTTRERPHAVQLSSTTPASLPRSPTLKPTSPGLAFDSKLPPLECNHADINSPSHSNSRRNSMTTELITPSTQHPILPPFSEVVTKIVENTLYASPTDSWSSWHYSDC